MSDGARQTGKIVSRDGRRYWLEFDSGGRFYAEADKSWPVGIRVIVLSGVIVARAGVERKIKYFQV